MTLTRLRPIRRRADNTVHAGLAMPTDDDQPPGPDHGQETWTGGSAATARLATTALYACLIAGPAALALVVTDEDAAAPPPPPRAADRSRERTLAAETAQAWVIAWLTTPRDRAEDLQRFYRGPVTLPSTASVVDAVGVADVLPGKAGTWSVTIAGDLRPTGTAAGGAGLQPRRYFQVPVVVTARPGGAMSAGVLALPAPVPAPAQAPLPRLEYGQQVPSSSPLVPAVSDFLAALVAGAGDVTRYTAPGAAIDPVWPPLAAAVTVTELRAAADSRGLLEATAPVDGRTVRVLATAELQDTSGQRRSAQYALTLTARAGRWEVAAVDPVPATAQPAGSIPTGAPPDLDSASPPAAPAPFPAP